MNAPDVAFQVARQFAALRTRYLWVRLATTLSIAAMMWFACWVLIATIDYLFEWPLLWRRIALGLSVGSILRLDDVASLACVAHHASTQFCRDPGKDI